jgi:hypothetical protein
MTRSHLFAAITLLALALLGGCSGGAPEPGAGAPREKGAQAPPAAPKGNQSEQVKAVVNRYNQLLIEGYRSLNMNPLAEVATVKLAEQAYHHMAAIGEGQSKMLAKLKQTDYLGVEFPQPDAALVKTHEVWDYDYVHVKTGKLQESARDVYDVSYELKLQKDGRWQLVGINAVGKTPQKDRKK